MIRQKRTIVVVPVPYLAEDMLDVIAEVDNVHPAALHKGVHEGRERGDNEN